MAEFDINIEKIISSSQDIIEVSLKLKKLEEKLEKIKADNVLEVSCAALLRERIKSLLLDVSDEAAKMDSFGDALQVIADKYRETEKEILLNAKADGVSVEKGTSSVQNADDKRNWWEKFCDWIRNKKPDLYDTTTAEQEKAADKAMKSKMRNVLQNKKYSKENWDSSTIEERKQILQDYMNELIAIYGLRKVKTKIKWSDKDTYTEKSITWGYYQDITHTVTLNELALSDSVGNWDSYDLLGTVGHELRHAYQHEAVKNPTNFMVSKETIDKWKNNFKNYIDGDTDYDRYRNQPIEVDARNFEFTS